MALLDDLHQITTLAEPQIRRKALGSAYWIFERNPWLSLDEQAEGIALLVAAFLRERDTEVRKTYTRLIRHLFRSRPYGVATKIDWENLTSQLSQCTPSEAELVLFLLQYSNDEKYLSLLESYFDDFEQYRQAVNSWVTIAYSHRYKYDLQAVSYLQEAEKTLNQRFSEWCKQTQKTVRKAGKEEKKERLAAKKWTQDVLRETQEKIQREVQPIHDRSAYIKDWYEKELYKQDQYYLPNQIRSWLALPKRQDKLEGHIGNLDWIFEMETSLPMDDIAQAAKVLVDYALTGEDLYVRDVIWSVLKVAFTTRRYVGMYLDWNRLAALLSQLHYKDGRAVFMNLSNIISYFGYANDECYLDVLKPYLEHESLSIRFIAAKAIANLLPHLAHYCPQAMLLSDETDNVLNQRLQTPDTPEKWQFIREVLEKLEQDTRPYFHYYSI